MLLRRCIHMLILRECMLASREVALDLCLRKARMANVWHPMRVCTRHKRQVQFT
jgi:hypothetical protein